MNRLGIVLRKGRNKSMALIDSTDAMPLAPQQCKLVGEINAGFGLFWILYKIDTLARQAQNSMTQSHPCHSSG